MKKKSILQSIKEFFLKLFKVIISLFKKSEPNKAKELETFETNINKNQIKLRELDHSTLPDTQSSKTSNDESSSVDTQDKTFKLYNQIKKDEVKDVIINIKYTYNEDRIIEIIDEILKEEYDIDVKRQKKTVEENIELLKEKLLEDVKEKIEEEEIQNEENLKEYLKEEIKKEIEEHPLEKKEPPKKYVIATALPKKKIEPKKEVIPKIIKKDIIQEIPKVVKPKVQKKAKETTIAMLKTKEPAIIKPKDHLIVAASTATVIAAKVAVDLVKPIEKKPIKITTNKTPLKEIDKTNNLSPFKEIKEDLPLPKKEEEKKLLDPKPLKKEELNIKSIQKNDIKVAEEKIENKKEPINTELKIEKEIQKEKEQTQAKIETKIKEFEYVDDHKDQMKENELAQINSKRLTKENEKIKEELKEIENKVNTLKIQEEIEEKEKETIITSQEEKTEEKNEEIKEEVKEELKKEEKKEEEKKKEEPKKEEVKKEEAPSPTFIDNIASTIDNSKIEMNSDKEFEDKEYDQYEDEINDLLYDIEMYRLKYDKVLTKDQKRKLREEERKLQAAKSNIQYQKALDIESERKHLEEEISPKELSGLELELKKQQLEHQKDLNDELITNVEDLQGLTQEQVRKIEKKLIKKKLRKALVVTQMGSILALPFIRNKYFFYFTAGLIANTELMFLGDLFRRKTREYEPIDLGPIKSGRDALNGALELTRDNIIYLETLESTTISKYPELSYDSEYLKYITALKSSLVKNHNKLLRKRDTLDKYIRKTNTKVKKLQQKEQQAA